MPTKPMITPPRTEDTQEQPAAEGASAHPTGARGERPDPM
jgi:hypothetical protein